MASVQDRWKQAAAESAVVQVANGMIVGLGSGSTAALAVGALGKRVQEGLRITGIPTSERTASQARALEIPLATLADYSQIDVTIDGADEVATGSLDLIKGLGGALLREKIVADASKRLVIVVDETKIVHRLGERGPVPVEVVPFGWQAAARKLTDLGAVAALRKAADGEPFRSDGGHYILDCTFGPIEDTKALASELDHIVGVVEHGLFISLTSEVHVGGAGGVRILTSARASRLEVTRSGKPSPA
ncbi:MAG TPA: ribose-5-phosphate isomerase RpiA [Bryobacteraceae bacterium]|nr:ribose-5-phosphate isomerase RpiA [Bryobacteraceae bacterium]